MTDGHDPGKRFAEFPDIAALEPAPAEAAVPDRHGLPPEIVLTAALPLAACGGGGGGGGGAPPAAVVPPPPPPPAIVLPTGPEATRFLSQASMGSSRAGIDNVAAIGFAAWLDQQFATARTVSHWDWLVQAGYNNAANIDNENGFDPVMWRQLIASPDQLRVRVGMALLDFLVVGIGGVTSGWRQFAVAAYVDVLMDGAFGNFRTLLTNISTNAAMGYYLTFLGNRRANAQTGAVPDENYARELMQLFTIGLLRLNADGTVQTGAGGQPIETYTQDDITGLARVFTGWNLDSSDATTPDRLRRPMANIASQHETGAKTFLGTTIPAGTDGANSLRLALDAIFAHPNVAPFVSKQLIQHLVTSNPAPAYVARISAVFENNGSGVRGDLRAVVRAILLDVEARSVAIADAASFGKLREPINRLTGWARAFNAGSASGLWNTIGDTSSTSNRLGQSPGRSPSVFNFFRPGYTPPNTAIATAGLVAPEFQITNEPSVIAYVNYMAGLVPSTADFRANYADIITLAGDSTALVNEVDLRLGARLSDATKATIRGAVDAILATGANGPANRVYTAVTLTLASPEFLVQK
ncbi:DUF1800 domain-containing protein [Sphingosinicella sp.]|uniref:DUF1800 domain-containing protein n=1 Tax=Sphingosinicella sp. TaxID=1917971 RepID=UPI004037B3C7